MLFIFGLLGGGATTLGLAAPLINDGLSVLFGFPSTTFSQIVVLLIVLQFLPIRPLLVWKKAFKCSVTLTFGARCYCLPLFWRSEEHTSELQSRPHLVCRLLLE